MTASASPLCLIFFGVLLGCSSASPSVNNHDPDGLYSFGGDHWVPETNAPRHDIWNQIEPPARMFVDVVPATQSAADWAQAHWGKGHDEPLFAVTTIKGTAWYWYAFKYDGKNVYEAFLVREAVGLHVEISGEGLTAAQAAATLKTFHIDVMSF